MKALISIHAEQPMSSEELAFWLGMPPDRRLANLQGAADQLKKDFVKEFGIHGLAEVSVIWSGCPECADQGIIDDTCTVCGRTEFVGEGQSQDDCRVCDNEPEYVESCPGCLGSGKTVK